MQSESRWLKSNSDARTYWNPELKNEGYREDKTVDKEDSSIKSVLIAGAVALSGYGAYRSGALKGAIKKSIEYAGNYKAISPTVTSTFRNWLKGTDNTSPSSLIRNRSMKDLFKKLSSDNFKDEVLERTKDDFKDLRDSVTKNVKKKIQEQQIDKRTLYHNTELSNNISTIEHVAKSYKYTSQKDQARRIMAQDVVKESMQSLEKGKRQLKRTGYRTATLGDLVEVGQDMSGASKFFSKNAEAPINEDTMEKLHKFLKNTEAKGEDGKVLRDAQGNAMNMLNSGLYKNMALDSNIMIDEAGRIADLRNASEVGGATIRSLANDFKIPFVGINPLRFFGLGKVGLKKQKFATLSMESVQPVITGKTGSVKMKDVIDEFGSSEVLVSNGKGYMFNSKTNKFEMFRNDLELSAVSTGKYGISKEHNDLRKMANIKTREYSEYTEADGKVKNFIGKVGKRLDLGFQDSTPREFKEGAYQSILGALDPSTYIEKGFNRVFDKQIFNKGHGTVKSIGTVFGTYSSKETADEMIYVALKKRIKFSETLDPNNNATIKKYFEQYLVGRDNLKEVNRGSLTLYHLFERMNQALNPFGLALSPESVGTVGDTIKNMITKRFLPAYAGYQAFQYINYLSEDDEGETVEQKGAKVVAGTDIALHKIKDATGLTSLFKSLDELTPGNDHLGELPLINKLGLTRTADETIEYYKTGMDPVRKGRYWTLGNTPFTGSKIQYYKPNWFRETMADPDFSEVKYGSRKEYFDNAWFPTLTSPFAPIRHFITDKYHYEKKHYYDRPYMLSSPEFEGVPIFGPLLSSTVGQAVKPQVRMHEEYWNPVSTSATVENYNVYNVPPGTNTGDNITTLPPNDIMKTLTVDSNVQMGGISTINPLYSQEDRRVLGAIKPVDDGREVYTTNSGQQSIVDVDRSQLDSIRKDLKDMSLKRVVGASDRATALEEPNGKVVPTTIMSDVNDREEDSFEAINPNGLKATLSMQYKDTSNVLGIYGFITNAFVLGDLAPKEKLIETSGYAYSFRDKFWEQDLGGLGGDLSEIFRRFVQPRRTDVEYYNPIRNTMAEWMPGDDYFTDFKHGDPYQKIAKGELRLIGTPYEKLWGIDPMAMKIDADKLSATDEELVNHITQNDIVIDPVVINDKAKEDAIKKKTVKNWIKTGFALEGSGVIEDTINNINNSYDAMITDNSNKDNVAIANIVALSSEDFDRAKNGDIDIEAISKLNHGLWATGTDKGYLHFVNKETDERYTKAITFDKEMLDAQLENVNMNRSILKQKVDNRELSRGDFYSPLDRFRMLADIAPYSKEFKQIDAILARSGMDEETKAQYNEIKDRVTAQKQANRTYEYRFKTANLDTINTSISKVDGSSIYVDYNGEQRKISFAGVSAGVDGTAAERDKIDYIKRNLKEGAKVKLQVDADELAREKTKSLKAIVIDSQGTNINRAMLKQGVAREKEDDWSAPAVNARFSAAQIAFGSAWETIAHANTYINTKFLQVRSAAEDYERREVYGKNFQSWNNPIEDYLKPSIYSAINRPGGVVVGALVGSFIGSSSFGRVVGAVLGASTIAIGKMYKAGYELKTGERWIPEPRRKERELNEYMDVLKFVKNRRLFEEYKNKALKEDGFDVDAYIAQKEQEAKERKDAVNELESQKKTIKEEYSRKKNERDDFEVNARPTRGLKEDGVLKKFMQNIGVIDKPTTAEMKEKRKKNKIRYQAEREKYLEELESKKAETSALRSEIQDINAQISETTSFRELEVLPDNAIKALEYRQAAEQTMYGYDPGEPLTNILSALPKKDRDRMKYFLKAPEEEREKILSLAPGYLKRPLQSAWGMNVDEKPSLDKYFTEHQLPGEDWAGWREDVNLDSVKVKMIGTEKLSNSEFNVWDDDVKAANDMGPIPLPSVNFRSNAIEIRKRLMSMVGSYGIEDADISLTYKGSGMDVDFDIEHDTQDKVQESMRTAKFM